MVNINTIMNCVLVSEVLTCGCERETHLLKRWIFAAAQSNNQEERYEGA